MRIKILSIIFILQFINFSYSQSCGTPDIGSKVTRDNLNISSRRPPSVCINMFFHIVRDDNGNGVNNLVEEDLNLIIEDLNSHFNGHGISLVSRGYNIINNSDYNGIDSNSQAAELAQNYNIPNAINYYIVDNLWNTNGGFITGTAITIPSNNLVIRRDRIFTATSPHEVGHCLDLYHTFQGTNPNTDGCAENIDGSNCNTCGDFVCDTPADYGTGNSNGYSPDLSNIMSYYENRTDFTNGQGSRMQNILIADAVISEVISISCESPTLNSIDFLCNSNIETFSVSNLDNDSITWATSSNLQIVASSSNSISVEANNINTSGLAWVEATLNTGYKLKDYFWIGKPSSLGLVILSSGAFNISTQRWYQLTAHHQNYDLLSHGNLTYEWQVPYAQLRMSPPKDKIISVFPTQTGTYPYKLRSKNICGCSDWVTEFVTIANEPGNDDLYISRRNN